MKVRNSLEVGGKWFVKKVSYGLSRTGNVTLCFCFAKLTARSATVLQPASVDTLSIHYGEILRNHRTFNTSGDSCVCQPFARYQTN